MVLSDALKDAAAALAGNDMARAEVLCREILKAHPLQAQALDMLAAALVAQGRAAEALAGYRAIVDVLHRGLLATQLPFGLQTLQGLGFRPKGILDVGAYEGSFAIMAKHFFPQAPVVMFEAQPGKEERLKAVAAALPGVDYRMALLGPETRAQAWFQLVNPAGDTSGSSLYEEQTRFARDVISLPMGTLDDVVAEFSGRDFDMLKLDVQGAELDVLRGAAQTLAGIEVIVIELSLQEYNKGAPLIAEVMARLDALGFALFDMFGVSRTPAGVLLQSDGIFLRRDSRFWPKGPFL
jgi:FkbM family methyltransferase